MKSETNSARGYLYIAAATCLWGISASLGRAAFTGRLLPGGESVHPIDPLILSQFRTTFSFLVLLPVLLISRGPARLRLPNADMLWMFVLGILGVAGSNYFYYLAINKTNVATAIIVQYTAPAWVLLYMIVLRQQKASLLRIAAVALAVTGIAVVIGAGSMHLKLNTGGVVAALLAAFSFAFYNISGHKLLVRYDHWIVLAYTTLTASLFWIVVNPPWKIAAAHYSSTQWWFLAVFALVSLLGPYSLYFAGLRHLAPTRAIIVSCLEPVFSILIAAIWLGEVVRPLQGAGMVLVLVAIVIAQVAEAKPLQPAAFEPVD